MRATMEEMEALLRQDIMANTSLWDRRGDLEKVELVVLLDLVEAVEVLAEVEEHTIHRHLLIAHILDMVEAAEEEPVDNWEKDLQEVIVRAEAAEPVDLGMPLALLERQ